MALARLVLLAVLVTMAFASVIPQDEEKKSRVHTKPLSDEKHYEGDDEEEGDHNPDFDHEAFLGKEEAQSFDSLSPEESQRRLGIIFEKIDKDSDGLVTEEELRNWMVFVQNRYIIKDTERLWTEHKLEEGAVITWESYRTRTYGEDIAADDEDDDEKKEGKEGKEGEKEGEGDKEEDTYNYKDLIRRDERRWKKADQDGDGSLSKDEYKDFLHPEDVPHMRDIVVDETLEDIDKDKDGVISLAEYIGDMWPNRDGSESEPEWVATERQQFANVRDHDNDGVMNRDEVRDWIIPADYDHSEAEAKHLIYESDKDLDGKLTRQEVVDKYDVFVGSQVTDFGEVLNQHDEF